MWPFGKGAVDKAVDIVGDVANAGMKIWDSSDFTAQERGGLFVKLLEQTKSVATSISRRHLLWFVMGTSGSTLALAIFYNHMGMVPELKGLTEIADTWKIGYGFVAAIGFYYFAHIVTGSKK